MEFLKYDEISEFLKKSGFKNSDTYDLIKNRELFVNEYCTEYVVPYDSFTKFLDYNPFFKDAFYNYNSGGDVYMEHLKTNILEYMDKTSPVYEEDYSITQLEKIFDVSRKEIRKAILKEKHPFRFLFRKHFSVVEILIYLKNHPDALSNFENRQDMLLSMGNFYEASARHILMLYAYYKRYGYIV